MTEHQPTPKPKEQKVKKPRYLGPSLVSLGVGIALLASSQVDRDNNQELAKAVSGIAFIGLGSAGLIERTRPD